MSDLGSSSAAADLRNAQQDTPQRLDQSDTGTLLDTGATLRQTDSSNFGTQPDDATVPSGGRLEKQVGADFPVPEGFKQPQGLVKQVLYRLYKQPEGPTLAEFRQGVATRYNVSPADIRIMNMKSEELPLDTDLNKIIKDRIIVSIKEKAGTMKLWEFWFETLGPTAPADIDIGIATYTSLPPLPNSSSASKDLDKASTATTFDETDLVASGTGKITSDLNDEDVDVRDLTTPSEISRPMPADLPAGNLRKKAKLD